MNAVAPAMSIMSIDLREPGAEVLSLHGKTTPQEPMNNAESTPVTFPRLNEPAASDPSPSSHRGTTSERNPAAGPSTP